MQRMRPRSSATYCCTTRSLYPWGTALCDEGAGHADGGEAVLGPITLSDYDADRRWKLRDKCLRVATFYRVMHMRERSRKAACMRTVDCAVFFRSGQRASLRTGARTATHGDAGSARPHGARAAADQWSRQGRVSAGTRMRMTAPDLYREARRNAPRRRAVVGTRRRVRLPSRVSVVDTEIGAPRLYGDNVHHRLLGAARPLAHGDG